MNRRDGDSKRFPAPLQRGQSSFANYTHISNAFNSVLLALLLDVFNFGSIQHERNNRRYAA